MKRLILMRHAKSDWSHALPDHERPLNARGRRAAPALGAWLRAQGLTPDWVLCSTSTRTRETLALLAVDAPVDFVDALYNASAHSLLRAVQGATADTLMVLAHNPGIAECAHDLLPTPPSHPSFATYPTGATLIARFDTTSWSSVTWGSGHAEAFIVPRDLTD